MAEVAVEFRRMHTQGGDCPFSVSKVPGTAPFQGSPNAKSADPAAMATYCFPSTANDIGDEYTDDPH
jgi:hypothetical protein